MLRHSEALLVHVSGNVSPFWQHTTGLSMEEGCWIRQLLELAAPTSCIGSFCWALAGALPCSQRATPINSVPRTPKDPY
ncbi:hypothetical protein J3F83DRAFT_731008 [Trichoderma novae-zelandiae]